MSELWSVGLILGIVSLKEATARRRSGLLPIENSVLTQKRSSTSNFGGQIQLHWEPTTFEAGDVASLGGRK